MRVSEGTGVRGGLIGLAAVLALAGCGSRDAREVAAPQRVACATPAVAEIVFALGCGGRVVGVSEFTEWPPEAAEKPRIGSSLAPNRERLLALEPDLILAQGRAEVLGAFAGAQGIGFVTHPLDTLGALRGAIAGFAAVLGAEDAGRELLREMEEGFAEISTCGPAPVFIALGHAPGDLSGLMTSGPGTFLDELVEKAWGSNVFSDVRSLWPEISREALIRRKPAILLDFQTGPAEGARRAALVADWERLGFEAGQVRILEEDYRLKPGPRAPRAAARLAEAICGN